MTDRRGSESEHATRAARIDPALHATGWQILPHHPSRFLASLDRVAVTEYPTDHGPADYALCVDGRILGIVEAKRLSLGPQNVLTQAERYSLGAAANPLNFRGYRVPFLYSTNGEVIWHHDVRHPLNRSRQIAAFHTPDALAERLDQDFDAACTALVDLPNNHDRIRPYQVDANAAIEQAVADRKRQMLLAMATGTGKTFTMVNEVYRLMKSGVASRILFLVDRRALAAQAVRAFASFEPEPGLKFDRIYEVYSQRFQRGYIDDDTPAGPGTPDRFDPKVLPESYLVRPNRGHAFVYICTIQRMTINLFGRNAVFGIGDEEIDADANTLPIPIHAFDVVIADECHRGYTAEELSVWRRTLDHFDAVKIGLTATPAAHTMAYFHDIVFRYGYERAVREGFLVDYEAIAIRSDVRMNGVFLDEGDEVGVVDPETGAREVDVLEDEREFAAGDVERRITAPDSNRKILEEIACYAADHQERTHRFPKTLIFAVNDIPHTSHADSLVDIARDVFGRGDAFVQKITGRVDRPLQRIREFRNRPMPAVVVTVDMLSTGVDIPDLEFIVFLRPVKSRILFEQMLGRGTRRGENVPTKTHFTVFDCFGGSLIDYFRKVTGITAEPPVRPQRTIPEIIDDIWSNRDLDYNIRCLVKRLQRINRDMSGEARERFAAFIPDGDLGPYAADLPSRLRQDFTGTMVLLHDPAFQDLLVNYQRAPRTFLIAYDTQDTVSSSLLSREDGSAEDYLEAFVRFVRENADQVDAIGILLDRPRDWTTDALTELHSRLTIAPQHFTIDRLQKVHELRYHKALVDIISMVKHAAHEETELLTAEERVERAIDRVVLGRALTRDQQAWLARIRDHLVQNLTLDPDDFDLLPIFSHHGGWVPADRAFNGELGDLVRNLNEAVAA